MKYLIIILSILPLITFSQGLTWVPYDDVNNPTCANLSSCEENIVCFNLLYTPEKTGIITSYTTGYFADCLDGVSRVVYNQSCLLPDNSESRVYCESENKVLINCSGHSGSSQLSAVEAGVPTILHQVCFQVPPHAPIKMSLDETTGATISISGSGNRSTTDFPKCEEYIVKWIKDCLDEQIDEVIDLDVAKYDEYLTRIYWDGVGEFAEGVYKIYRSTNSIDFEEIGAFENEGQVELMYFDKQVEQGIYFYKVEYVDQKSRRIKSNMVRVALGNELDDIRLYPNPTSDFLYVNSITPLQVISILDMKGNVVTRQSLPAMSSEIQIDVRTYQTGLYTIRLNCTDGIRALKFVVLKSDAR